MKNKLAIAAALTLFAGFALSGPADAQGAPPGGAIQPGTEFPAAPLSHGGISLAAPSQVLPPPGAAPEAAPPPPPAPKKRRRRHH